MRSFRIFTYGRLALVLMAVGWPMAAQADDGVTVEELKQETQALAQKLQSYTADQREEAVASIKKTLSALDKRIDSLERSLAENWDDMNDEAREETRRSLQALRNQREQVAEWYARLKDSSASAWGNIKDGFSDAYEELSEAWRHAEEEIDEEAEKVRKSI